MMANAAHLPDSCQDNKIEVMMLTSGWRQGEARMAHRAASAALALNGKAQMRLALVLAGSRKLAELNHRFAGDNAPTDVLAFPADDHAQKKGFLGDVILARPVLVKQALRAGVPTLHHIAHLAAHGALHLLGFDHATPQEATRMGEAEKNALASLGLPAPLPPAFFAADNHHE